MSGEKLLLKFDKIDCQIQIPKVRGLRVKDIFQEFAGDVEFTRYFPNWPSECNIPREFFLNVN